MQRGKLFSRCMSKETTSVTHTHAHTTTTITTTLIFFAFVDLDNKPKRLLRNIPAQHLYLRMATTEDEIVDQLEKIKAVELQHLFLACSNVHAERYLGMVYFQ